MKKADFMKILNAVIDSHRDLDKEMVLLGGLSKETYNHRSASRTSLAIDLEYYLDKEGLFEN